MKSSVRGWNAFVSRQRHNGSVRHLGASSGSKTYLPGLTPRQLRSNFWIPQASLTKDNEPIPDAGRLLIRAGYLRQAYAGIFHLLPLGLRVQSKLEALVDKHMCFLSASKVSLSSITSQQLWERTGRLSTGSEFFKFQDRHKAKWLLAPTHEEEITALVKDVVHAPGHLPIRLYQTSRKYRDERRPRGGLLRGREFLMKDLYTFDKTEAEAHATYADVRQAYRNLFDELKVPYIEARADSGNMGGNLSHEFHFPSNLGEDDIITCTKCDYAKNEEFVPDLAVQIVDFTDPEHPRAESQTEKAYSEIRQSFISEDRMTLVRTVAVTHDKNGAKQSINPFVVKECLSGQVEVDTGLQEPESLFSQFQHHDSVVQKRVFYLFDQMADEARIHACLSEDSKWLKEHDLRPVMARILDTSSHQSHLLKKTAGDRCPECEKNGRDGTLNVTKAIEVGHTFHLGSRYSSRLDFTVPLSGQHNPGAHPAFVSMGCHGIGVSRLIAAVASSLSDGTGLIWPRVVAPFEVLILVNRKDKDLAESVDVGNAIYDNLSQHDAQPTDVLIDDRENVAYGWKLKDADLIGFPVVVVIGRGWLKNRTVEIQCRRLKIKEDIKIDQAPDTIRELLSQL